MPRRTPPTRWLLLGTAAGLWLLTAAIKGVARPWIAEHGSAWYIAWLTPALGAAPSLLAGLSVPLWFLGPQARPDANAYRRACFAAAAIVVVAEFVERRLPGSTFDWLDVAASLVGVCIVAVFGLARNRRAVVVMPARS